MLCAHGRPFDRRQQIVKCSEAQGQDLKKKQYYHDTAGIPTHKGGKHVIGVTPAYVSPCHDSHQLITDANRSSQHWIIGVE